jgi:hypothetical protein
MVVMFIDQPPMIEPWSPGALSKMNKLQVVFGFEPIKVERVLWYGPAGAGDGNANEPLAVGLYVPERITELVGSEFAAESSNVREMSVAIPFPPVWAIRTTPWPDPACSKISISSVYVWVRFVNVTVTSLTVPARPETVIGEGYGVAEPWSGMVIVVGL